MCFFVVKAAVTTEIYNYCPARSLPDALPILGRRIQRAYDEDVGGGGDEGSDRRPGRRGARRRRDNRAGRRARLRQRAARRSGGADADALLRDRAFGRGEPVRRQRDRGADDPRRPEGLCRDAGRGGPGPRRRRDRKSTRQKSSPYYASRI